MPIKFSRAFGLEGRKFTKLLRALLPKAVLGSPQEQVIARSKIQREADKTSIRLKAHAVEFLRSDTIKKSIVRGQMSVASQTKLTFGGVNTNLLRQLSLDTARDLAKAADSIRGFAVSVLRKATVIATQNNYPSSSVTRATPNFSGTVTGSLLSGTLAQDTWKQQSARLLEKLGLNDGDRVIFMSGRTMDAEAYAETVVRTRTMEAMNNGKAEMMKEGGYDFIETSEHDGVDPNDICYFLQGKVWALAENDLGIPLLPDEYGLPPWHPNCGHTFGAWQPKFENTKDINSAVNAHEGDEESLSAWGGKALKPKATED